MNDWTLRQWNAYVDQNVTCPDCAWLLRAMVRDHDAGKGITHPGIARLADTLCRRNRRWVINHLRECVADGHLVLVKRYPNRSPKADEYAIPWLDNPITKLADDRKQRRATPDLLVQKRTSSPDADLVQKRTGERTRKRTRKRTASFPSKEGKNVDAAALRGRSVVDASKSVDTPPHSYPCSCPECTAAIEAKTGRVDTPNGDTPADNVRPLRAKRKR